MNPKAGHSMMPIDPSTPDREAPKARQARSSWQTALPSKATNRDRSPGRTSRPELPASDPLPTRSMCSGKRCHRPCRSLHERKPGSQTKDDIGTEVRDERSCGRLKPRCTMPSAHTSPSAIGRRPLKSSYQRSPRRRLRAWIRSDGHAHAGVETWVKLTFESDHSMGADQLGLCTIHAFRKE